MFFSVIVPIYNVEKYLCTCLDSILAQDFREYELILVDDGSADGCSDICDAYAEKDGRVCVIHKENGGLVSARNAGIRKAQGEYILYVDGDDWVSPDWMTVIQEQILAAPRKPDLVVFGSVMLYEDRTANNLINAAEGFYDRKRMEAELFPRLIIDRQQYYGDAVFLPAPWNKAYKRELLEKHHCFDEGIRIGEDTAFTFECCLYADSLVICRKVLYYYNRSNPRSMVSKNDPDRLKKRERLFRYIQEHIGGADPVIDRQLDDFYASRIIADVIFVNRKLPRTMEAGRFLAKELKATHLLDYVHVRGITFRAKVLILLLKARLCRMAVLGIKALDLLKRVKAR